MRVAVTGASGRLGRALIAALEEAPFTRPDRADRVVPHGPRPRRRDDRRASAACSTATDRRSSSTPRPGPTSTAAPATPTSPPGATARRPARSPRRSRSAAVDLVVVSTNEVFDGDGPTAAAMRRRTSQPRRSTPTASSKLSGEQLARAAYAPPEARAEPYRPQDGVRRAALAIVRTVVAATARRATRLPDEDRWPRRSAPRRRGEPLKAVDDETGSPTYAADLAEAIVELLAGTRRPASAGRVHHLVNGGPRPARTGRARSCGSPAIDIAVEEVPAAPGSARRRRRAGPSSSRRRRRRASRCAPGRHAFADAGAPPLTLRALSQRAPRSSASTDAPAA